MDERALCTEKSPDKRLLYTYTPGECGANSRGFRDVEHAPGKPPNTFRIVLIGDSVAEGRDVDPDSAFGRVLERMLNRGALQRTASGDNAHAPTGVTSTTQGAAAELAQRPRCARAALSVGRSHRAPPRGTLGWRFGPRCYSHVGSRGAPRALCALEQLRCASKTARRGCTGARVGRHGRTRGAASAERRPVDREPWPAECPIFGGELK
jgi:hypothetical protein